MHFLFDIINAMMHIYIMLKKYRKQQKLTQEELARKSGVDQCTISRIESGQIKHPRWDIVSRLAKTLAVSPEKLFPVKPKAA
jgi:transcriptional regulator with XRE-family HTH domain